MIAEFIETGSTRFWTQSITYQRKTHRMAIYSSSFPVEPYCHCRSLCRRRPLSNSQFKSCCVSGRYCLACVFWLSFTLVSLQSRPRCRAAPSWHWVMRIIRDKPKSIPSEPGTSGRLWTIISSRSKTPTLTIPLVRSLSIPNTSKAKEADDLLKYYH